MPFTASVQQVKRAWHKWQGPVGEALIMTGLGLAVAIPAVIFITLPHRINKQAIHLATDTAHQILSKIVQ